MCDEQGAYGVKGRGWEGRGGEVCHVAEHDGAGRLERTVIDPVGNRGGGGGRHQSSTVNHYCSVFHRDVCLWCRVRGVRASVDAVFSNESHACLR